MRAILKVGTALAAIIAIAPLAAQISGGSAQINKPPASANQPPASVSQIWVPDSGAWMDNVSSEGNQALFKDLARQFTADAGQQRALAARLYELASNPKMSPELKREGLREAVKLQFSSPGTEKAASYAEGVAKVLQRLNMVSVGMKALGYVVEGDFTGAAGVLIQETTKSGMATGGGMAGSWFPGGQFIGASLGDYAHDQYVKQAIDSYENAIRDKAYADKYIGKPWLTPQVILDRDGKVRALPIDQYMDKQGVIRTRSPEEQAAYEKQAATDSASAKRWAEIERDFKAGKISAEQYAQLRGQYAMRNRAAKWNPQGAGNCEAAANDPAVQELLVITKRLNAMAGGINADSINTEGEAKAALGQANALMALAGRAQTLTNQVQARYTKECLKSVAADAGIGPSHAPSDEPAPNSHTGSGTVYNKDGSREVLTPGKDADGKPVSVWTTYDKNGRVTKTRIER